MANSSHVAVNATRLREDQGSNKQPKYVPKVGDDAMSNHASSSLSEKGEKFGTIRASNDYERKAYLIGICGGSASGKTTVARNIIQDMYIMRPPKTCVLISMDSFYRDFNEQERELAFRHEFNFDTPGAFDFALLKELLRKMKFKQPVDIPQYSFVKHAREKGVVIHIEPAEIVLFEGILAFHDPEVAALCDLKIFVDIDPDVRLARRLRRDVVERGRDLANALYQYEHSVKPSFDQFIAPTKSMADIIVPRGGENHVAIDIIIGHLYTRFQETPFASLKSAGGDDAAAPSSAASATTSPQPPSRAISASSVLLSSPSARQESSLNRKYAAVDLQSTGTICFGVSPQEDTVRVVSDHHRRSSAVGTAAAAARRENAERRRSARRMRSNNHNSASSASSSSPPPLRELAETVASSAAVVAKESHRLTPPSTSSSEADGENEGGKKRNIIDNGYYINLKPFANQVGGHAALLTVKNSDIVCKPLIPRELDFYKNPPEKLAPFLAKFKGIYDVKIASTSSCNDGKVTFVAKPVTANDGGAEQHIYVSSQKRRPKRAVSTIPILKTRPRHRNPAVQHHQDNVQQNTSLKRGCLRRSESTSYRHKAIGRDIVADKYSFDTNSYPAKAWSVHCLDQTLQKFRVQPSATQKFLALENIISCNRRPCIIDLKMGIQQYGDDATAAKKRSQTLKSSATTSVTLGVRACGMQVYRYDAGRYVTRDKYFGRTLDNAGFERLLHSFLFNGFRFLGRQLLLEILSKLRQLCRIVSELDGYRFFSSSLLVIYEGCGEEEQLGTAVDDDDESSKTVTGKKRRYTVACSSSAETNNKVESGRKIDVRMIDFAHTTMPTNDDKEKDAVVHNGPDAGYLFGLNNLIRIFQELSNEMVD